MWMKLPPAINNCPNRKRRKCETLNPQQQLFELFSLTTFKVLKSRKAISQRKDQFKFLHDFFQDDYNFSFYQEENVQQEVRKLIFLKKFVSNFKSVHQFCCFILYASEKKWQSSYSF